MGQGDVEMARSGRYDDRKPTSAILRQRAGEHYFQADSRIPQNEKPSTGHFLGFS